MRVYWIGALFLLLMTDGLRAADRPCVQQKIATGIVSSVLPALGFRLDSGDQAYFLEGLFSQSDDTILKAGDNIHLYSSTNGQDRYGRLPAFVMARNVLIQEKLLASGKALIFASELNADCLLRLRKARKPGGSWKKGLLER